MSHAPSHLPSVTAALWEKILTLLAPLFLAATGGDVAAARQAVGSTLACYNARTDAEVRLAALTVAFGFGALDALGQAVSPDLSLNQVMRLRSNATALSRAGHHNQAALDKLRKETAAEPDPEPEPATPKSTEADLPATIEPADLLAFARSITLARNATIAVPMSRQQRRAAERQIEKTRLRQQEDARRIERAAAREATAHFQPPVGPTASTD